jgi:saccharopine dehydrogenase (NADP+, L-glutamate forming)
MYHTTAVKLVLDGTISDKGILAPLKASINEPLMKELRENYGSVILTSLFDTY